MKILFCGDIVGKAGRRVVLENIATLKTKMALDFVIVNGENAAHGFGITSKICEQLFSCGVDVITLGNHAFKNRDICEYIKTQPQLLRPANYHEAEGVGFAIYNVLDKKLLVLNLLGKVFMQSKISYSNPFIFMKNFLHQYRLGDNIDAIIVDFHAETTSEKNAMGVFLDGKVSAVLGTHTHIPTADARILPKGTAYQTDVGMCGDYDSVIGMEKESSIEMFFLDEESAKIKLTPSVKCATLAGVVLEINNFNGLCRGISQVLMGGYIENIHIMK